MPLNIDYLSAHTRLKMAGLSLAECERGANLLANITPQPIVGHDDPAQELVDNFLLLYVIHEDSAWEYLEKLSKRGYE